jgi:hypothetical protein
MTEEMYPPNWPKCPACGEPALDGHITCGQAACGPESRWRSTKRPRLTQADVDEALRILRKRKERKYD